MWFFGWGFMFLGPLCLVIVGLVIYWIVVSPSRRNNHAYCGHTGHHYAGEARSYAGQGRSFEVLNERFAKGEITREQYLEMRKTMEAN